SEEEEGNCLSHRSSFQLRSQFVAHYTPCNCPKDSHNPLLPKCALIGTRDDPGRDRSPPGIIQVQGKSCHRGQPARYARDQALAKIDGHFPQSFILSSRPSRLPPGRVVRVRVVCLCQSQRGNVGRDGSSLFPAQRKGVLRKPPEIELCLVRCF